MIASHSNSPKVGIVHRVRAFWHDYQWFVIAVLALVAIGLGLYGFTKHKGSYSSWDIFYLTLQLFTLESGSHVLPVKAGWELNVARLLAPAVTVLTAALALYKIFFKEYQTFRLRFTKDHVVICGAGLRGLLLAGEFNERVMVIKESESGLEFVERREPRVFVWRGNVADTEALRKAQVHKARLLISVCEDDGVNAEVATHAYKLSENRKRKVLSCYIHVVDPKLCELLREREIAAGKNDYFRLQFLNFYESGVRALLHAYPAFEVKPNSSSSPVHMLVIGLGPVGESIVVQTAKRWRDNRAAGSQSLQITVVDKDAEAKKLFLCVRYPRLEKVCNLISLGMDTDSLEFQRGAFLFNADQSPNVTIVYVCLDTDARSLAAALAVFQHIRKYKIPIVVCTARDAGLATLLRGVDGLNDDYSNLHSFGLLDRTIKQESLLAGTNEILARAIHEDYMRKQALSGASTADNPSMVSWDELSESLKTSNRRQADHIGEKLRAVGCGITLATDWDAKLFEFDEPGEIERMARLEHQRWMKEREDEGWRFAPGPKDIARKTTPYLIAWEQLPTEIKDTDRNMVREMPAFLARVGFEIYRLK